MRYLGLGSSVLTSFAVAASLGAAPAAPSYHGVAHQIAQIRTDWGKPGAAEEPNAPGWNALFDSMTANLQAYTNAPADRERLEALHKLYETSAALGAVNWTPVAGLRESLREWLRPRVRLAWAERRLTDSVKRLPAGAEPAVLGNRDRWVKFIDNDLGSALRHYDAAPTVAERQAALKKVYESLNALGSSNQSRPWVPSLELQTALNDLYNQPNMDIAVDVGTLAPALDANLVTSGPVERKGYISQVTAGPKTGFGLLPSDDGIAFYNSQMLSSVTPITDFQRQIESDKKGRKAAKLYQFGATTIDTSELTITAVIRPSGLSLYPSSTHNSNADITSDKQQGGAIGRGIAGLLGLNQPKITQKVYDNAIGQIRSNIVTESQSESEERVAGEAGARNAQLAQYLIGGDRAAFRNVLIEGLSLRSQPGQATIGGTVAYLNAADQVGADAPQPPAFDNPEGGVTADLHLSSIMANFTRGYLQSDDVKGVENLVIVTKKVAPDQPPSEGIKLARNADYPTFLRSVAEAQAANDPKVLAVRLKRPSGAPEFGVDARGYLVALVNDFQIEVPAPPAAAKGGLTGPPAKVFRVASPQAEFVISFKVEAKTEREPIRLTGRIEDFQPGPGAKVYALNDDENQATPLTAFTSTFVLGVFRSKVAGQPIDVPLSNLQLRGFAIRSVSPLDPSGWIRVNLVRTSESPAAGVQ